MKKRNFIYYICFFTIAFSNNKNIIKNPQLYNVWTVEALEMKLMVNNSIEYYAKENPEDSLQKMTQSDRIIIIESKKVKNKIYELRYGSRGKYTSLDEDRVKWILPKKLRDLLMEKDYYYVMDDSYIKNSIESLEVEYLKNVTSWTNKDIYFSLGSKTIFDRGIYRLSSIGGANIYPSLAFSLRVGDDLIGYPSDSRGSIDFGLLGKIYEIGLQTPIFNIIPDVHNLIDISKNQFLQGGLGGYGKVSMFGAQIQLSFSDMDNNKLIKESIEDSSFVDYMNMSFLAAGNIFNKPLAKSGHLKIMFGCGYYQISHKSLIDNGNFIDRLIDKDGIPIDGSVSSFFGAMIRSDFVTLIKNNSEDFPLLEFFAQLNGYVGNKSWMAGIAINYKRIGVDISYKRSVDKVDWAPEEALYASINYSR